MRGAAISLFLFMKLLLQLRWHILLLELLAQMRIPRKVQVRRQLLLFLLMLVLLLILVISDKY